jgi:gamma-glutamyltranspeptidase/glutathione hydrolase
MKVAMPAIDKDPLGSEIASAQGGAEVVATAFPCATDAGLDILRLGGNAVDAAVAAAWALCVCEPSACGLGGQTVLLVHRADGQTTIIDGHSCAPMAASLQTISCSEQQRGYRSCTVPTTPATLHWAHGKYGSLERERVVAPAIRIAEDGYAITPLQHRQTRWVAAHLRASSAAELFLHEWSPPPAGVTFHQPELAATLRQLAEVGVEDFYRGAIARQIANDMRSHGGLITEQDLANCGPPIELAPICTMYRGFRVLTVPPPGGGAQLLSALNILAQLVSTGFASSDDDWRKVIALTTSAVFRDRDLHPFRPSDSDLLLESSTLSEAYALKLAGEISGRGGKPVLANGVAEEPGDTTHLSVRDRYGNIVLLTQSIQSMFGAKVAHRDLGFLYNNYLCTCPRTSHPYGLRGRCRPRSNVAPALVMQEGTGPRRPVLALGAAGSRRIISALLQVISGVIDHGLDVAEAVAAPRIHGLLGRKVWIERPAASEGLLATLRLHGREPIIKSRLNFAMGSVQALQFFTDGSVKGTADPRRDGKAATLD